MIAEHFHFSDFDKGGRLVSKQDRRSNRNWKTCCCCLQVRTVTISIGIWDLIMDIMVLSFSVALLTYDFGQGQGQDQEGSTGGVMTVTAIPVPVPDRMLPIPRSKSELLNKLDNLRQIRLERMEYVQEASKNASLHVIPLTVINMLMTLLMIYGAARGKLAYLMPFLVLRVTIFCIFCVTTVYYIPSVTELIMNPKVKFPLPMREEFVLRWDPPWGPFIIVLFMTVLILVKACIIGVIWKCYKNLKSKSGRHEDPTCSVMGLHQNFLHGGPDCDIDC
ncbi:Lysosomal-associated transmembrane protein 4A [Orchesella cincta]|uniref:Lysosomal-associated transmembrane protein 4A n=1 Tax=Orchesella cincta TaxID=48709 RepID=A0A1D2MUH0_ORCCI|nr:Lysosomal-associated transmembrane protein 4A [Orchesella cincta]